LVIANPESYPAADMAEGYTQLFDEWRVSWFGNIRSYESKPPTAPAAGTPS
jgi:hypothetical protein